VLKRPLLVDLVGVRSFFSHGVSAEEKAGSPAWRRRAPLRNDEIFSERCCGTGIRGSG
jgi:hypothetical protein